MLNSYLNYWSGKTVLITGGSSGIGLAIAEYINGVAKNIIIISNDDGKLELAESKLILNNIRSQIIPIKCNIGDSDQVKYMSNKVKQDVGCPDVIINNAGFASYYTFDQMSEEEVVETADINFIGFLRVTRAFIPDLIEANSKSYIVNIASVAGSFPITPNSVYGAAKAGMMAFSELLEIELHSFGVKVLTVCPGRVVTPFFDHISYKTRREGSEMSITTPIEDVVCGVIKSVALGRTLVFIPSFWRLFSWWINFDRLVSRRLYKLFLARRVAKLRN